MKTCTKCGETKPKSEFGKHTSGRDGLRPTCKSCHSAAGIQWAKENREKRRETAAKWRAANPDKSRAYAAKYYAANIEKERERWVRYRSENPDKVRAACKKWRTANPDKARESTKRWLDSNPEYPTEWRKANPETCRIIAHNYRSRKRENGGQLSVGLADKLFKLQRGKCACCGKPLGDKYHMDHIMPLALGGTNTDDNIQLLRASCNVQKNAKHPVDFMRQRGFLL